jgi:endonuclease-3
MDFTNMIIKEMKKTISYEKRHRFTALKMLQRERQDPFRILIATILSARTRDENTTRVVMELFKRYKSMKELAEADVEDIKVLIHSLGFYNIKARRVKQVSQLIMQRYHGIVPADVEKLIGLPGVGRKTANCVLVYGFNQPAIPVDTHVHRISNRIGLVNTKNPKETELELGSITNRKHWIEINDVFVTYGQTICLPIRPKCKLCRIKDICKFYQSRGNTIDDDSSGSSSPLKHTLKRKLSNDDPSYTN